jgi:hypothetical protein
MRLRIHRSDGKIGSYHQGVARRAAALVKRLDPQRIFTSGPIVIGVLNPFSVINADEICCIEIETDLPVPLNLPDNIDQIRKLSGREEYEAMLARQWPRWMDFKKNQDGELFEALIELSMRGGESIFLHVTGRVSKTSNLVEAFFHPAAIMASYPPNGTLYINTRCLVRSRVYHSRQKVDYPEGLWFAEADDV